MATSLQLNVSHAAYDADIAATTTASSVVSRAVARIALWNRLWYGLVLLYFCVGCGVTQHYAARIVT